MFDEPPAFAGAETRLSLCFTREEIIPFAMSRVVLEEGEIDEIREDYSDERSSTGGTGFASDTSGEEASYTESDTESAYSSMPELIDENGDVVEDEYGRDDISIPSINTREDIANHIEILQHIFTLQE